ncbi:5'-nucleotidase [Pseudomethylobacillus aquaticus]|uniref:5'-nucleotidase n=1 Tax=Pseudomethylobacillus aquaticus TaxID=2676064 RepID=A0A3N0UYT3_9PROT|nr:5'-nucleotidase [Pseudomethylobacillus aquaticus]ROH85411.1 5'-nucleotidase [Pseudomethylobacillus aquaticus]
MSRADSRPSLTIGIASRALFDLTESHQVYEQEGLEAYSNYQITHEDVPLQPGVAFNLTKKLLSLNDSATTQHHVEVVLLSRNSADTGLRAFNSIRHHQLNITRAVFTGGEPAFRYVPALGVHLFLSADPDDVRNVLDAGYAAATILPSTLRNRDSTGLRIAFDGDAVLFSDESERIYKEKGLEAFSSNEMQAANQPLPGGPFKHFLELLHTIQSQYPADASPIRTALVTARGAPAHERVIRTLRHWGIRIDEALFLAGMNKGPFLEAFGADIFFDDQRKHCDSARLHVATGHVPHGITNQD